MTRQSVSFVAFFVYYGLMDFVKNKYVEYGIFSVIFFITVFFSFFHLTEAPAVWYDEGYFSQIAENVSQHGIFGIQNEPGIFSGIAGITAGYPLIAPIALSYKIFGVSVLSGRFVSALYILAVILVVYFFVRRVFGIPSALGSALLLATFPVLYGGGKSILGEVPAFFYMILSLFFFERAILKQKKTDIALSGIFLGVMASAKVTFLLAGLPAFGFAVLFYRRHIPRDFKSIGIFLVGFCSAFSLWILTQFSANDTFSSVLKFYFDPYSIDPVVSNFSANILKFFTEISPLYLFLFTLVWAGAFCFRFVQKENIPFSETVSFIFTLLIYLVFLKSPGWYRYFFPAQLIVILFVPNAIFFLSRELSFHFSFLKKKALSLAVFLILFLSLIQIYQTSKSSFVASYYHSTRTEQIEKYFTSAPRNETYFLYNVPELVIFLPTDTYYQYSSPHIEQVFGGEQRQKIKKGIPDSIILSGGAYKGHEQDFAPYKKSDTIAGRYVVLKK